MRLICLLNMRLPQILIKLKIGNEQANITKPFNISVLCVQESWRIWALPASETNPSVDRETLAAVKMRGCYTRLNERVWCDSTQCNSKPTLIDNLTVVTSLQRFINCCQLLLGETFMAHVVENHRATNITKNKIKTRKINLKFVIIPIYSLFLTY